MTPVGQKKHLNPVIENVKLCSSLKPRRVAYSWTGETHFKVDPDMCGKRVFRMSARILVSANDMNPVAIADSGASHVIYPRLHYRRRRQARMLLSVWLQDMCVQWNTIEKSLLIMSLYLCVP